MFELKFSTDNAAFEGEQVRHEINEVLGKIADAVLQNKDRDYGTFQTIFDSNGNDIGRWRFQPNKN